MQSRNPDLREMLIRIYQISFGHLPEIFMENEGILKEVVHQLSHHAWPATLKVREVYDCLVLAREYMDMDHLLFGQPKAWVREILDSPPPVREQADSHESQAAYL